MSPSSGFQSLGHHVEGGITVWAPVERSSTSTCRSGVLYCRVAGTLSLTRYHRCERGRPARPVFMFDGGSR
jgi:hypothetical protein